MAKFKVDDWCYMKNTEKLTRVHILGITQDTFPEGVQIRYRARLFCKEPYTHSICKQPVFVDEIELES